VLPVDESGRGVQSSGINAMTTATPLPMFESARWFVLEQFKIFLEADAQAFQLPDLLSTEAAVMAFTGELAHALLAQYVAARLAQVREHPPTCECGQAMTVHRLTAWTHKTLAGEVRVHDPYYYCARCRASARPLHRLLGTEREAYSMGLQEATVDLVTDESCGSAVEKLERHHPGVHLDRTAALRLLHSHGQTARQFLDGYLAQAREQALLPAIEQPNGVAEMEVEFDGGMIPVARFETKAVAEGQTPELTPVRQLLKKTRKMYWEEAKVGVVQIPGEVDRSYSVRPTAGLDESFDDLFSLACLAGWTPQTKVRGLADGARHIRPRMQEAFNGCDFMFVLDRPHAREHLSNAGEALQTLNATVAQEWADGALDKLERGDAALVVKELHDAWVSSGSDDWSRNDVLRLEANYFDRNADAVAYAVYRNNGWSTASSEVESAHRHVVQQRLKISGAWWRPDQVDHILALRMIKANGLWDQYWQHCRARWRDHAARLAAQPAVRKAA
jgi:hypothetical protein